MPVDERQFSETGERALAGGNFDAWRAAMMSVLAASASDAQWKHALNRLTPAERDGCDRGKPEARV